MMMIITVIVVPTALGGTNVSCLLQMGTLSCASSRHLELLRIVTSCSALKAPNWKLRIDMNHSEWLGIVPKGHESRGFVLEDFHQHGIVMVPRRYRSPPTVPERSRTPSQSSGTFPMLHWDGSGRHGVRKWNGQSGGAFPPRWDGSWSTYTATLMMDVDNKCCTCSSCSRLTPICFSFLRIVFEPTQIVPHGPQFFESPSLAVSRSPAKIVPSGSYRFRIVPNCRCELQVESVRT
jgi:hypothetical protein